MIVRRASNQALFSTPVLRLLSARSPGPTVSTRWSRVDRDSRPPIHKRAGKRPVGVRSTSPREIRSWGRSLAEVTLGDCPATCGGSSLQSRRLNHREY